LTDELVELAKNNDEITAVLAHELGHVKGRHALRQTLQGTISGLIVIAITGDVSAIAAGLPALMLNMSYSRDLELDADDYALRALNTACIPSKSFATILLRLEKSHSNVSVPEMISSHPDTKARVMPFLKHHNQCT
jgi:Zn-dependent protease with chaperone function